MNNSNNNNLETSILIVECSSSKYSFKDNLSDDYTVIHSANHDIAFSLAIDFAPSFIIIESNNTPENDYNLCKKFKDNPMTSTIPILFCANSKNNFDPCLALEAGAIDYLIDPIDISLLKAKVKNYIALHTSIKNLQHTANIARELNPNTFLPGNTAIASHIKEALSHNEDLVVVYADLDNFKAYNDKYGFSRGDLIIKLTAEVINDALKNISGYTFLGHIGGDDFVFIAPKKNINSVTNSIINNFDNKIPNYYSEEDKNKGYISAQSRLGKNEKYPLMTISMGGVNLEHHTPSTRYEEISDLCSEVKCYAKTFKNSCFYIDRRHISKHSQKFILSLSSAI